MAFILQHTGIFFPGKKKCFWILVYQGIKMLQKNLLERFKCNWVSRKYFARNDN